MQYDFGNDEGYQESSTSVGNMSSTNHAASVNVSPDPAVSGVNIYRRGVTSKSSAARPAVEYNTAAAMTSSGHQNLTYNPYTAPSQSAQQYSHDQMDWFSTSSSGFANSHRTVQSNVTTSAPLYTSGSQSYPSSSAYPNHPTAVNVNQGATSGSEIYSTGSSTFPYSSFSTQNPLESVDMLSSSVYSGSNNVNLSGPMQASNPYSNSSYTSFFQSNTDQSLRSVDSVGYRYNNEDDYANEPPLLEELGINIPHITSKSLAVLLPMSRRYAKSSDVLNSHTIEDSPDLAGPLAFALLLGSELLLAGKIQFAYIYTLSLFSCISMSLLLNLLSPNQSISVWTVISVLGYCLLPVNLVAALNIFVRIKSMKKMGLILAACTIGWCSISATRLFENGCGLREQRWLVGYPCVLLYSAFILITIF